MMNRGYFAVGFIFGAIAGGLTAWLVTKSHYEEEFEFEEFDPEEYRERKAQVEEDKPEPEPIQEDYINPRKLSESNLNKPSIMDYAEKIRKEGYRDYAGEQSKKEKKEVDESIKEAKMEDLKGNKLIEVIDPDEFGENDDYDTVTWKYFADGVLADDADEAVNDHDISEIVGLDFADHFGEYEPDAVHIRNDDIQEYIEILRDERTYEEFCEGKPKEPHIRRDDE